ncbi:MAG: hypothetical protein ACFHHU_00760 [Porticoccaceae bacterium]
MKYFFLALVFAGLVPLGATHAQERPQYHGEEVRTASSPVFITPEHRRHVVGIAPLVAPGSASHPDATPVVSSPLPDGPTLSAQSAFVRYCDEGRGMTKDDWVTVNNAGGLIPDALRDNCLPPK